MSDNIEIVMDIDSLEIFDVIDLDKNENMVDCISEGNSDEKYLQKMTLLEFGLETIIISSLVFYGKS
ncbi:Uncharacterised protein [Streptococcus pneumoniae]|uniref:Uncharacterized protein n=1 Tax=Streptococcus pneumoniae TaxID=1313 RepID=A0A0T8SU64_STREE|nr:hypothetical protein SP4UMMC_05878 [Streptococcus pneumoniae MNZ14]KGI25483.1 hypothetical protein BM49_2023 [Streptococcus pneumoniae]KGI35148.1 hypothetical protein X231_1180 [Streptococcus pneumoniae ECC_3510]KXW41937.1 hypothetical protein NTPn46_11015 [Streptococcus pneumoniae]KXW53015.1 hypothetical protein NTPn50_10640 [Streptococcus pneumoniae]